MRLPSDLRLPPRLLRTARCSALLLAVLFFGTTPGDAQFRPSSSPMRRPGEVIAERVRNAEARAMDVRVDDFREDVRGVAEDLRVLARTFQWQNRLPESQVRRLAPMIVAEAARYRIPPALLIGIIVRESDFKPTARSPVGATGLMQVMPFWPRDLGYRFGRDLTDEATNLRYGTWVLQDVLKNTEGDLRQALLRYNGCKRGTNTPTCFSYPDEIQRRVERHARNTCAGRAWQNCVVAPLRAAYASR